LAHGSIHARQVIVALNAFFPRLGLKRMRVFPLALTASLTRVLTEAEEEEIGRARSWGVLSPSSLGATMRLTQDRRILIRNTAEYLPGGIDGTKLEVRRKIHADGLRKRFPFLDESAIDYTWSGNICISRNAKPVFEESRPGLFLCGCYNASGVARGTIMGRLIADLALRDQSELLSDALSLKKPSLIPPRPFFDLGANYRLASERRKAVSER
jgi:glycine/D-amino acid oxidase-like deaminating enzyme